MIANDLGYDPKPLQFYNGILPGSTIDGYLYIGYVSGITEGAGGILLNLKGNNVYQTFATVAQGNSVSWFTAFDQIAGLNNVMFSGYRMKI